MTSNKPLAIISGFGGINSSGRSSGFLGYKNLVFESLKEKDQLEDGIEIDEDQKKRIDKELSDHKEAAEQIKERKRKAQPIKSSPTC